MTRRARFAAAVAALTGMTWAFLSPAEGQTTFTNATPITVPVLGATTPAPWPGSPYPSQITVSSLTGTVTDVNVILHGFDCSETGPDFAYPEDIDLLLVGPTGANVVVLSDVGGANAQAANQFSDITLALDDEAAAPLPADTLLTAGTYRPLDDDDDPSEQVLVDTFPSPAPAPSTATSLSVFDGTNPNGTWSLYLADDYAGPNNCRILRGWSLVISTTGDTTTTTTAPTTTTTAPTTTTTAPTTTTTAPTTTTTAPTTTTTAPTTTTTAPTTTTTAPTTTTTAPTTTTTAPTTTTTTAGNRCDGLAAMIVGTEGDDTIRGTNGPDVILGLGGNDTIMGLGGDDVICGGAGDDAIRGHQGDDRLFGGSGDDHLVGAAGTDLHDGGAGEDLCAGGANDTFSNCERGFPVPMSLASSDDAWSGARRAVAAVSTAILLAAILGWPGVAPTWRRRHRRA